MSATTTLTTIMDSVINTTVDFATTIFTEYWPYVLVVGAVIGLVAVFKRLAHVGAKGQSKFSPAIFKVAGNMGFIEVMIEFIYFLFLLCFMIYAVHGVWTFFIKNIAKND